MTPSSTRSHSSRAAALLLVLCLTEPAWAAKKVRAKKGKAAVPEAVAPAPAPAPAAAPAKPGPSTLAKEQFDAGRRNYDLGRFDEALKSYSAAFETMPLPGFLFNIAQCHRQLGDFSKARFFYRRYLDLSPSRPANAEQVEGLIKQTEEKLVELEKKKLQDAEAARQREQAQLTADRNDPGGIMSLSAAKGRPGVSSAQLNAKAAEPLTKRWWFWTGVGVLAAGAATGAYFATAASPRPPSLGEVGSR